MTHSRWYLPADRYFDPDPAQRRITRELYESVADLPIVSPHGHVDPRLFADEDATFGIEAKLASPEFRPRVLFERFNIEVLCTTDFATDSLRSHQAIRASGWEGDIRPTFRPDDVVHLLRPGWRENINALSALTGVEVNSYPALIQALESRRAFFKARGATATDHDATTLCTAELSPREADQIFQRALKGQATVEDATRFFAHMLIERADEHRGWAGNAGAFEPVPRVQGE